MRKKAALVSVLVAALGVAFLVNSLTSASAITRARTIVLQEGPGRETDLDLGARGDSQGDQRIFSGSIADRHGKRIGETKGHCTLTDPRDHRFVCVEIFTFENGSITIEGSNPIAEEGAGQAQDEEERASAVTGGTGVYANVRGEATEEGAGHVERIVLHLIP